MRATTLHPIMACTMISPLHETLLVRKSKKLRRPMSMSMRKRKKRKAPDQSKLKSNNKETNFDKTLYNCSIERVIAYCLINLTSEIFFRFFNTI